MDNQRMLQEFIELASIDVASGQETELADVLEKKLQEIGFVTERDNAGDTFGGSCGNLLAVRKGEKDGVICFCSHMDRVPNGFGIHPVNDHGILRSSGDTILAADDLSGVAAILEGMRLAIASGNKLPTIEILYTVGEEAGLFGAKAFDVKKLQSKNLYILDSPGHVGRIINNAPGRAMLEVQVFGQAAHAGNEPEKGIDAAKAMAEMLATLKTGRIDELTTSNFSSLWAKSSTAMNVVCDHAILRGEMRSRDAKRLDAYEAYFRTHCQEAAEKHHVTVSFKREDSFLPFLIPEDSDIITIAKEAMAELGIETVVNGGGGGMDANIFNQEGKVCVGVATGYFKNHSRDEYLHLEDFYQSAELVARIISKY